MQLHMKIVIAPDSFKECLPASRVAAVLADEFRMERPGWEVLACPLSDGGEGFAEIVTTALGGRLGPVTVTGPEGIPVTAYFGMAGETGIIEVAAACGLSLVPPERRNPLRATSRGVGELMMAAFRKGCRELLVGLGGSATCDGGEGLLSVPDIRSLCGKVTVRALCDVSNPFTGPTGAARVFAPQKGADAEMVEVLENKMIALATRMAEETGTDVSGMPGAGAAGGLAGALAAYFGAVPESGIEAVIGCTGLLSKVSGADWIVTGEGRSDAQTLSGKVPAGILRHKGKARVALLSGAVSRADVLREAGFDYVAAVTPQGTPLAEALRPDLAERHLRAAVRLFLQENQ